MLSTMLPYRLGATITSNCKHNYIILTVSTHVINTATSFPYLMRVGHQLHGRVIHNHLLELNARIQLRYLNKKTNLVLFAHKRDANTFFSYILAALQEHAVAQLHDVRLVDTRHLLAVVLRRIVERELGDTQRLGARNDLQALDDTGNGFVLERRVLAFGLLANHHTVDVLVAVLDAGQTADVDDVGEEIEFGAQFHVERLQFAGVTEVGRGEDALMEEYDF